MFIISLINSKEATFLNLLQSWFVVVLFFFLGGVNFLSLLSIKNNSIHAYILKNL